MGCWNGTDLITQLPIMCGDEVALIPIKQSKYAKLTGENTCYGNTYFKPLPVLLYGEYDDYGCIENITGDIEQFKEIIQKECSKTNEEIISKVHEDFGSDYSDIESYVRYIERGEISNIGFVLIHKELFNKLKDFDDFWDGKERWLEEYFDAMTYEKRLIEAKEKGLSKEEIIQIMLERNCNWSIFNRIELMSVNKDSISAIMSIDCVLSVTRKYWFPQTCAGGQVQIEQPHRIINEFYNKYLENYDKEEDEEE